MPSARAALLALLLSTPALALGGPKDAWIDFFGGWAGPGGGQLFARVHHGKPLPMDKLSEGTAEKFLKTIETLELEAIPGAQVTIALQGHDPISATADSHGFVEVSLPGGLKGPLNKVTITKKADKKYKQAAATYLVPVWKDHKGQIGIIADIDDTLIDSDVPNKLKLGWNLLFHSTYDVKVFKGAGAAVSAATGHVKDFPVRPTFYLSGSPWNLHTRLAAAFKRNGLPKGAFLLRRYSKEPLDAFKFKHPHLQTLFAAFPDTKWILYGDTGEKDPEVYAQMHTEKPAAIDHIFIHNVTKADPKSSRFVAGDVHMTVFNEWSEVAAAQASLGLVFGKGAKSAD